MISLRLTLALCLSLLVLSPAAHAADSHATTMPGGPVYVRLKPISFSVIGPDNRIAQEVSVQLDLELEPEKNEQMLDPYKRKMMDAFLVALNEIYTEHKPGDPPVGGDDLKDKLLKVVTDIAGPGIVHGVLIMSIGERGHAR
jgi:flagellar basal body-associated protein FliL